jgi:hypothetical protein
MRGSQESRHAYLLVALMMDNVGLKLAIDIKRELEDLEEELKLIAVVFQLHAKTIIEDKVRG